MISKYSIKYLAAAIIVAIGMSSCRETNKSEENQIYVSIAPIKYIVEEIVGSDFKISVMVPAGGSPETFEPTPKQYIALNEAQAVISTGLIDFEQSLLANLKDKRRVVNLSKGVEIMEGSCSHDHNHESSHSEHHHHGVDPHIWTSPKSLQVMAQNCFEAINTLYPDSLHYKENYLSLKERLQKLDTEVQSLISNSHTECFIINHPAYTYFARDYHIEQISIEEDGKEPSTRRIGQIIERARAEGVNQILYQSQFPASVVDVIAKDAEATTVAVDPLSENIVEHIMEFTEIITRGQ